MQASQVVGLITVVAIIALALGVSVGYELSSARTITVTQIQTAYSAFTQLSTVTPTVVTISGQSYEVVTVTEMPVLVGLYTPTCETVSGRVTTVYSKVPLAESTTVTLVFPSVFPPNWQQFYVTVTTNNTNTFSSHIENTTISC